MIIGLDVGGTHIDGVIIANKKIIKTIKVPLDDANIEDRILLVLSQLTANIDANKIHQINLSTTIITNAIVENRVNKVGLIAQKGPGLTLESLTGPSTCFLSGYTDHRGVILEDYKPAELKRAIDIFKSNNITNIAIATKFSVRNPATELKIAQALNGEFKHVSLSHQLSGALNYPRRITTTILNASVGEIFTTFYEKITAALALKKICAPVYILKADGGLLPFKDALVMSVQTILSGPAASVNGFLALCDIKDDAILFDIGGTTTDIFILADGVCLFEPLGATINNEKTLIRSVFAHSIGLGGDSAIDVVNNNLVIGPTRFGKPFALGGPKPTLTDVFIFLKVLAIGDHQKAQTAIRMLAHKLSLSLTETADLIIDEFSKKLQNAALMVLNEVNNKPIYTIKELLANKKIVPQSICVIGGPAKLLKHTIETHFKLPTYCPEDYAIANAIGAALSKTTATVNVHVDTRQNQLFIPEVSKKYRIDHAFTLHEAATYAFAALHELTHGQMHDDDFEIIEASSFNMVDGFRTTGKTMRLKAQVKPGLIYTLDGAQNER